MRNSTRYNRIALLIFVSIMLMLVVQTAHVQSNVQRSTGENSANPNTRLLECVLNWYDDATYATGENFLSFHYGNSLALATVGDVYVYNSRDGDLLRREKWQLFYTHEFGVNGISDAFCYRLQTDPQSD